MVNKVIESTVRPQQWVNLLGREALVIVWVFVVIQVVTFVVTLPRLVYPVLDFISLLLGVVSIVVACRTAVFPLGVTSTVLAVSLAVISEGFSLSQDPGNSLSGYTSAHIGAYAFTLLLISLQGRILFAWSGFFAVAVLTVAWCLVTGNPVWSRLLTVLLGVGVLLLGTLFITGYVRTATRIAAIQASQNVLDSRRVVAEVQSVERERHIRRLLGEAGPMLQLISSGVALTAGERAECLAVEGSLRDAARAQNLSIEPITSSVRAARLRGVDVRLYDDRYEEELPVTELQAMAEWVSERMDRVHVGSVTVRLLPVGRDCVATMTSKVGVMSVTSEFGSSS